MGLDTFHRSRDLACLVAMMAYSDTGSSFHRELAIYVPDPAVGAVLMMALEVSDLGLNPIQPAGLADRGQVMFFSQHNTSISRKSCSPYFTDFSPTEALVDGMQQAGPGVGDAVHIAIADRFGKQFGLVG